jgi:hypothetical protein
MKKLSFWLILAMFSLILLDSCGSVGSVGSMRKRGPMLTPETPQDTIKDSANYGGQMVNNDSGPIIPIPVTFQKFDKKPGWLANKSIEAVLGHEAPIKYIYVYKYIYKGRLSAAKNFQYRRYLAEKGNAGAGDYPGDAVVIANNGQLWVFSDSLPDLKWFKIINNSNI